MAAAALAVALLTGSAAWGDLTTGNEMLLACQQENTKFWVSGYCMGAIDGIAIHANFHRDICEPEGVTARQRTRVCGF